MKTIIVDVLLALSALAVWLGCIGFIRLKTALDKLHCATFVNVAAGFGVTLAVALQDGWTSRSWKTVALFIATLIMGAATSHAVGRAIFLRDGEES